MTMYRLFAGMLLILFGQVAGAQCPSALELADLRSRAELAQRQSPAQITEQWNQLISAARACQDRAQEFDALQRRSDALFQQGAVGEALKSTQEWLQAAKNGTASERARVLLRLARLQTITGEITAADQSLRAAIALLDEHGSILERAQARSDLSRLDRRRGNYLDALRNEQIALNLREQTPERTEVWRSTLNIATLYEQVELFDEARTHYQRALEDVEQSSAPKDVATVLTSYAGFLNDFGAEEAQLALQMAQRADLLNSSFGDPVRQSSSQLQIGRAWFGLGNHHNAELHYRQALALAQTTTASALLAHVQFRWGELDLATRQLDSALSRVEAARKEYENQGNRHRLIKTYALLERVHEARGDQLAAALAGREHFRLRNELLGAGASGKLGELLSHYALADAQHRNETLQQENTETALRLQAEQRALWYLFALVVALLIALTALAWRHGQSRRLNSLLRQQAIEIEARRAEIEARRIDVAAAHERLKAQSAQLYLASITDPLTGLRNRGYGLNALRELLGSAKSLGLRPVVMMLDIDHFKQINDRFGHAVGDRALERVAENLLIHAPADAIVARLGGEEFLFVLRDADPSSGVFQAELIRRRLLELRVEHETGVINISTSIGVCHCATLEPFTVQAALRAADQALYQAKGAGRNCVRVA